MAEDTDDIQVKHTQSFTTTPKIVTMTIKYIHYIYAYLQQTQLFSKGQILNLLKWICQPGRLARSSHGPTTDGYYTRLSHPDMSDRPWKITDCNKVYALDCAGTDGG